MRSLTLRQTAVVAVVPLALGSLAACGNAGSTNAADPQAGSSSHTRSSTTPGSRVSSVDFRELMKSAASKLTTVKVAMTGDASGQTYRINGEMDLTGDKPAMEMTMNMGSSGPQGVEMRLVGGTMYVSMGALTQGKFVKFDLNDPQSPLGSLGSTFGQLDPSKMLGQMSPDLFGKVTYVGTDAAGKHYHAVLDTAKAPQLKGLPASATANLPKSMGYDTWLDAQGRLSKVVVSVPKYMKMTMSYTDYGAPVHVSAPPASQITAMPGAASSL